MFTLTLNDLAYQKKPDLKKIHSIVFSGGGALGAIYGGVYDALFELRLIDEYHSRKDDDNPQVKTFAGSSAGSLMALVGALGYSSEKTDDLIETINFSSLLNSNSRSRYYS